MKIKTSITLPEDLLEEIDRMTKDSSSRSRFIETALRGYLEQKRRERQAKADLEILNRASERLNAEAADVLSCQVEL